MPSLTRILHTPVRLSPSSVRLRLTLGSVAVFAVALLVLGALIRFQVQKNILGDIDADLAGMGRWFGERWPFPAPPPGIRSTFEQQRRAGGGERRNEQRAAESRGGRPDGGRPAFASSGGRPGPRSRRTQPRVLGLDGRTLPPFEGFGPWDPATFALAARQGRRTYSTIEVGDETMRVLSLPLRGKNGQIEAVLQAARPLADLNFAIGRLTRTLLTFVPIALLIAAAGGAFLTDRILRPVRHITQAASRIGAEDLSQRLPVAGGDEFAKLAATFNGLLGRLESAFEQQRRFTADASHELRTPLAAIKVHTSLALMGERTPAQYKQTLRTVDRSADTATRIVQDLLLLARSDTGRFDLRVAPTPLSDVLLRAVETVEATAHDPDRPPPARITLDLHDPTLAVAGDAHHLSRLFTNLLDNALRHTPSDGSVRIIARAEDANTVVVDVEDTGEGIAPEHLPHVTERFYRVDAARARAHGGTGLGLSICKSIAEAHGGGLVVESEVGRGTRVRVTLPRATALPAPPVPASTGSRPTAAAVMGRHESEAAGTAA